MHTTIPYKLAGNRPKRSFLDSPENSFEILDELWD